MQEVVAELTHLARRSPEISQRSGVSVRVSITNYENLVSNALRRAVRLREPWRCRASPISAPPSPRRPARSSSRPPGDGDEAKVIERLAQKAVLTVFNRHFQAGQFGELLEAFGRGMTWDVGEAMPAADYERQATRGAPASAPRCRGSAPAGHPARVAAAVEFVLGRAPSEPEAQQGRGAGGPRYRRREEPLLPLGRLPVAPRLRRRRPARGDGRRPRRRRRPPARARAAPPPGLPARGTGAGARPPRPPRAAPAAAPVAPRPPRSERRPRRPAQAAPGRSRHRAAAASTAASRARARRPGTARPRPRRHRQELERIAAERRASLDALPKDLGGAVRGLQDYQFVDPEAWQKFQELMLRLRQEMNQSLFGQLKQGLQGMGAQGMDGLREMLDDLNRAPAPAGRGRPARTSRDSWIAGARCSRASRASISCSSRSLASPPRCSPCSRASRPSSGASWRSSSRRCSMSRACRRRWTSWASISTGSASASERAGTRPRARRRSRSRRPLRLMQELHGLGSAGGGPPGRRAGRARRPVDPARGARGARRAGGPGGGGAPAARREARGGGLSRAAGAPSGRSPRTPFARSLSARSPRCWVSSAATARAATAVDARGAGGDPTDESKAYEFGDPFLLDLRETLGNAVRRQGPGLPVRLEAGDFAGPPDGARPRGARPRSSST